MEIVMYRRTSSLGLLSPSKYGNDQRYRRAIGARIQFARSLGASQERARRAGPLCSGIAKASVIYQRSRNARRRMQGRKRILALAGIPAALALVLVAAWWKDERVERDLAEHLRAKVGPEDVVIFLSSDISKMDRLPGMRVIYSESVFWNDVVGYDRAWVVGAPYAEVPMIGSVTVSDVGPYRIHRLDMIGGSSRDKGYDLLRHLPEATVIRMNGGFSPCPLRAGIFACPGEPWYSVEVKRVMMGGAPIECIYSHPKDGSRLVIEYLSTAGGKILLLEGGIDDDGVYYPQGAQVTVAVESSGRALGEAVFLNVPGPQTRSVVLKEDLPSPAPLTLSITAPAQDTRHFCFRGWLQHSGDVD